jgi:hypothetical protein
MAVLFMTFKEWNQPKGPWKDEWMKKIFLTHTNIIQTLKGRKYIWDNMDEHRGHAR